MKTYYGNIENFEALNFNHIENLFALIKFHLGFPSKRYLLKQYKGERQRYATG